MPAQRILIVDDSATARQFFLEALIRHGYECITAKDGAEGVYKAKAEQPDLILMDIVMPGMDGFNATRAITRDDVTKHIPVIICTSKRQDTDRIWGMRQGARGLLVKPINAKELIATVAATF